MQDEWELPQDLSAEARRLFHDVMQPIMSLAIRQPEASRAEIVRVVEILLDGLRKHWDLPK